MRCWAPARAARPASQPGISGDWYQGSPRSVPAAPAPALQLGERRFPGGDAGGPGRWAAGARTAAALPRPPSLAFLV